MPDEQPSPGGLPLEVLAALLVGLSLLLLLLWRPRLFSTTQPSSEAVDEEEQEEQEEQEQEEELRSDEGPPDLAPMSVGDSAALVARLDECKAEGNALYRAKDWAGAAAAYSEGVKLAPDLEEQEVPPEARQACAVVYTNRSAARYALKQ
eukprot:SAG31_NODE_5720_length_2361_cov_1.455349_2_plen_150_part_00